MTYQTVPTVTTGDMWTASQHNTYVRDNFSELWPYTAKNQMAYAATSSTLAKTNTPTDLQILSVSSGVPTWINYQQTRKFCFLEVVGQSAPSGTTDVAFTTEVFDNNSMWSSGSSNLIQLPNAGIYKFDGYMRFSSNSSGRRAVILYDGSNTYMETRRGQAGSYNALSFSYVYYTASSKTTRIRIYQTSGSTLDVDTSVMVTYLGAV